VIEQLKTLEELQQIDLRIDEIKKNQVEYPRRIEIYNGEIDREKHSFDEIEEAGKELIAIRRDKELDLQNLEERIERDRAKLMQVKTNKEYHALQKEIENMRADRDELETEILSLMDKVEESEHEIRRARESFTKFEKHRKEEIGKLETNLERIDEILEEMVDQYDDIALRIDPTLIERYLNVRKLRRGVAVVPVIKGTCQGCHMKVPPQVFNLVIRNEEIITCPNCHRILYYENNNG